MGHTPIPIAPTRWRTKMETLKDLYVVGKITLEQFEEHAGLLIESGREDERYHPPPPKPGGLNSAIPPTLQRLGVHSPPPSPPVSLPPAHR